MRRRRIKNTDKKNGKTLFGKKKRKQKKTNK